MTRLINDAVEIINLSITSSTPAPAPTTGSTPELLTTEDRQTFLRKLDLGPAGEVNVISTTSTTALPITSVLPNTTPSTTTTTKTATTAKRGYKYRPTYFFSTPTFGPPHQPFDQCLCPCAIAQFSYDPNYDPFEEQKLLFELSRAFNRSLFDEGFDAASNETFDFEYPEVNGNFSLPEDLTYDAVLEDAESFPFDAENIQPQPNPVAVKPNYFQAYEFIDILAKMQALEDIESNEAEPSDVLVVCVRGFLTCIENKAYDWPEDDWPKTDSLADKARKCYLNFQSCSGSAMLIPDRKDSQQLL